MSRADDPRSRDAFLAMLGHELRQPIAPIVTALEIMRQRRSREVGERARRTVERQVAQLARFVEDLLDYSNAQRGLLWLRADSVDIRQVLEAALETAEPTLTHREQRVAISAPTGGLTLQGDPARLTQVFANLLNNTARFSEPGSEIAVEVESGQDAIAVRVRDTTHGMPAEMVRDMSKLFVNADQEMRWPSVGIGLAVVRTLVELHGGSVEAIAPADERGAEFVVRLPLELPAEALSRRDVPRERIEPDPQLS